MRRVNALEGIAKDLVGNLQRRGDQDHRTAPVLAHRLVATGEDDIDFGFCPRGDRCGILRQGGPGEAGKQGNEEGFEHGG